MTTSSDFSPEQWETVREGPTSAGMIVSTAERGGTFREALAMAKAYAEARQEHGESELLDELVSAKPDVDRGHAHSPEELKAHGLEKIREAVALVEEKGGTEELGEYRAFVVSLAKRVAAAKGGVGEAEEAAIGEIETALGLGAGPAAAA
jgi:biotin-(acetyl-CoA carboxylase) ligase